MGESQYQCYDCGHRMSWDEAIEGDGTCPKCGAEIKDEGEE